MNTIAKSKWVRGAAILGLVAGVTTISYASFGVRRASAAWSDARIAYMSTGLDSPANSGLVECVAYNTSNITQNMYVSGKSIGTGAWVDAASSAVAAGETKSLALPAVGSQNGIVLGSHTTGTYAPGAIKATATATAQPTSGGVLVTCYTSTYWSGSWSFQTLPLNSGLAF